MLNKKPSPVNEGNNCLIDNLILSQNCKNFKTILKEKNTTKWLIKRYLQAEGISCIHGQPATGKTYYAISLCLSILFGEKWGNKWQTKQGKSVVYLANEDPMSIKDRIKGYYEYFLETKKYSKKQIIKKLNNFYIFEKQVLLQLTTPNKQLDKEFINALDFITNKKKHIDIIVVDTMAQSVNDDLNSSTTIKQFHDTLLFLAHKYHTQILVIAHEGKSENSQGKSMGHNSWLADVSQDFTITQENSFFMLKQTKNKNDSIQEEITHDLYRFQSRIFKDVDGDFCNFAVLRNPNKKNSNYYFTKSEKKEHNDKVKILIDTFQGEVVRDEKIDTTTSN